MSILENFKIDNQLNNTSGLKRPLNTGANQSGGRVKSKRSNEYFCFNEIIKQ